MEKNYINVIGAGLAGCEAAWQAAERGVAVRLYEMKPEKHSPAHHLDTFAELVCSNSLRSDRLENAVGLLKEELRRLGSLIMRCADACRVPAGGALAVDRERFSAMVTEEILRHPNITVLNSEITELPDNIVTVTATGPLTSEGLSKHIALLTGEEYLYFYDAAAPIVTLESIDMSKAFKASRYGKGEEDYINCPMNREQYDLFQNELVNAETAPVKEFEKEILFEGCMPVESMAARGYDTMRFGPLKPVGLIDPATGKEPYAAVQLRQDNAEATLYNIVGFQTHLKWPEQKRVFGLIPGLENAEFVRYGVMHRNTYINSPKVLDAFYRFKVKPNLYFAGQLTGVEGYIESTSSGFVAGLNAAMDFLGGDNVYFSRKTAIGALSNYVSDPSVKHFQPMNINYGLIDTVNVKTRDKKQKYLETAAKALSEIDIIRTNIHS